MKAVGSKGKCSTWIQAFCHSVEDNGVCLVGKQPLNEGRDVKVKLALGSDVNVGVGKWSARERCVFGECSVCQWQRRISAVAEAIFVSL